MMKRLIALTAFGAGYVAGAAAGRERYEQIRRTALRIKEDPHVQDVAGQAAEFTKEHGSALVDKVAEKVTHGEQAAAETVNGLSNPYQRATP
ncbi:MAG: hypothetical protein ACJ72E_17325 [Marmoricola sp.]